MSQNTGRTSSGPSSLENRGVIRPDELYTLNELKHRLGITNSTLRAARRSGLRVYYKHRHAYVYGRDWIEYVILSQDQRDC
jgi:hypothetical protein